jgi:hypothetical protein
MIKFECLNYIEEALLYSYKVIITRIENMLITVISIIVYPIYIIYTNSNTYILHKNT